MNIIFKEINADAYFSNRILKHQKTGSIIQDKAIYIGQFNKKNADEPTGFKCSVQDFGKCQSIVIYFLQMEGDDFHKNCNILISTLKLIKKETSDCVIYINIITEYYNYFYKEIYSRIYLDTTSHNQFKVSKVKILSKILIQSYFGYRFAKFSRAMFYRVKRLIRH